MIKNNTPVPLSWSLKRRYSILVLGILILAIGQITSDIYLPSVPALIRYFGSSTLDVQLTFTLYFIGYGLSQFIYGPLSDHFGRRPVVLFSLSLYLLGTAVCFYAQSIMMLLIGRIIQGIGMGGIATTASALPQDIFQGKKISEAYSYIGIALAITPLIAPILGGYLQQYYGWHANFFFLFCYALTFAGIFWCYFPETNVYVRQRDLSLQRVISNYWRILKNAQYTFSLMALVLTLLGELLYIVWMPILLQTIFHYSPVGNGWMMLFPAGGLVLGSLLSTYLCRHYSQELAIIMGVAIVAVSALALSTAYVVGFNQQVVMSAMTCYMVGSGLTFPLYISICTGCYPQEAGTAAALMSGVLTSMAGVVGAVLLTHMAAQFQYLPLTQLSVAIVLVMAAASLLLAKRKAKVALAAEASS